MIFLPCLVAVCECLCLSERRKRALCNFLLEHNEKFSNFLLTEGDLNSTGRQWILSKVFNNH
jgi:hypothetical protein